MAINFQFAFLGWQHSYVASLTRVTDSGQVPLEAADIACFRLPVSYTEQYKKLALRRYISNIRGHDFLCHTGRWTGTSGYKILSDYLPATDAIIDEIEELGILADENKENGHQRADLKLSLGAQPGSFFADAFKLGRYKWKELPNDLDNAIQSETTSKGRRGYGNIKDVTMNASGGWVMNLEADDGITKKLFRAKKSKSQFCWGGQIPDSLREALQNGKRREARIVHIFLNHQNRDEYVLLFNDGQAHISLHFDFEKSIRRLVETWTRVRGKRLQWNFSVSSRSLEDEQRQLDAAYYNRRGLFYLSRRNSYLALSYLREAILQDPGNKGIHESQRLALMARRLWNNDPLLEDLLVRIQSQQVEPETYLTLNDSTADGWFRNKYISLIKSPRQEAELAAQLEILTSLAPRNGRQPYNGWSYSLASGAEGASLMEDVLQIVNDRSQDRDLSQDQRHAELQEGPEPVELENAVIYWRHSELSGDSGRQRRPSELSVDPYDVSPIQVDRRGNPDPLIYGNSFAIQR